MAEVSAIYNAGSFFCSIPRTYRAFLEEIVDDDILTGTYEHDWKVWDVSIPGGVLNTKAYLGYSLSCKAGTSDGIVKALLTGIGKANATLNLSDAEIIGEGLVSAAGGARKHLAVYPSLNFQAMLGHTGRQGGSRRSSNTCRRCSVSSNSSGNAGCSKYSRFRGCPEISEIAFIYQSQWIDQRSGTTLGMTETVGSVRNGIDGSIAFGPEAQLVFSAAGNSLGVYAGSSGKSQDRILPRF